MGRHELSIDTLSLNNVFVDQVITGVIPRLYDAVSISSGAQRFHQEVGRRRQRCEQPKMRVPLCNSIHSKVLNGQCSLSEYQQYVEFARQPEHSAKRFEDLISTTAVERWKEPARIATCKSGWVVVDGAHRLAVSWKEGIRCLPREKLMVDGNVFVSGRVEFSAAQERKLARTLRRTRGRSFRNGWRVSSIYPAGYHTWDFGGLRLQGQRVPSERINSIRSHLDLDHRCVLDIGCNTGGMLYHAGDIAFGVGVDFDVKSISAARRIQTAIQSHDLEFGTRFSFERVDLNKRFEKQLAEIISRCNIDLVFLLSLGSWVNRFNDLLTFLTDVGLDVVFETNNREEGKPHIEHFKARGYGVTMIADASEDDVTGNARRQLYFMTPPA
jgi:hypothetical protein